MEFFTKCCDPALWQRLLGNDFARGYMAALSLFIAIFVLVLFVRIALWLCFRTRRCSNVVVPGEGGDIVISRDAVTAVLEAELKAFPQLYVHRIRITRRGKKHFLALYCAFSTKTTSIPALLQEIKPRLQNSLKEVFGIESVKAIRVVIEEMEDEDENSNGEDSAAAAAAPAVTGPGYFNGL